MTALVMHRRRRFPFGKVCSVCLRHAIRVPTAWYLKPVRVILGSHASTRWCTFCDRTWFALHF